MRAPALAFRLPRPTREIVLRAVVAGSIWGVALSAGFAALAFHQCGMICLDQIAVTTSICVAAGIPTIGPVAAFGRNT